MPVPLPRNGSSDALMPRMRTNMRSGQTRAAAVHTRALMSEAMTRKLLDAARETLAHSYELLEQVRRGRESTAREAASVLERLQSQEVGCLSPRAGVSGNVLRRAP